MSKKLYTYEVAMPVAGVIYATIESDEPLDEDAVVDRFHDLDIREIDEWDCYRRLVGGNVCYAPHTRVEISESIEELDE